MGKLENELIKMLKETIEIQQEHILLLKKDISK